MIGHDILNHVFFALILCVCLAKKRNKHKISEIYFILD